MFLLREQRVRGNCIGFSFGVSGGVIFCSERLPERSEGRPRQTDAKQIR
ncbi:MAG: hypothetical protein K6F95_03550 [Selenomonas sp.]|nr:hypothetical protein [Selenomonas sp.]